MKLRILDNSIRLRLDRSEVDLIGAGESVSGVTHFPGGMAFTYRLEVGADQIGAGYDAGGLVVVLPDDRAAAWAQVDEDVSIEAQLPLAEGELRILIEKDFECLEPRSGESQDNRFANPKALS